MALLNNFKQGRDTKWTNGLVARFVNLLNKNILAEMEKSYKHHLGGVWTDPYNQIGLMALAYKNVVVLENSITTTTN